MQNVEKYVMMLDGQLLFIFHRISGNLLFEFFGHRQIKWRDVTPESLNLGIQLTLIIFASKLINFKLHTDNSFSSALFKRYKPKYHFHCIYGCYCGCDELQLIKSVLSM